MNKIDFIFLFDVTNGNPNGDPDYDNSPRMTDDGKGLVTDVCLKRKVRNFVELAKEGADGYKIHIRDGAILNEAYEKKLGSGKASKADKDNAVAEMSKEYYDVRAFGEVFASKNGNTNSTGPIQMSIAMSYNDINVNDLTITRMAVTSTKKKSNDNETSDETEKSRTMGRKHIVRYGLYHTEGHIIPFRAAKSGLNEEDVELFYKSLENMFEFDRSSSRGEMVARKLIVFEHDSQLGNAPSHKLFERVKVTLKDGVENPTSFDDYEISIDKDNLPEGVTVREIF